MKNFSIKVDQIDEWNLAQNVRKIRQGTNWLDPPILVKLYCFTVWRKVNYLFINNTVFLVQIICSNMFDKIFKEYFKPFLHNFPFWFPLKLSGKQRFSDWCFQKLPKGTIRKKFTNLKMIFFFSFDLDLDLTLALTCWP